MPAPGVTDRLSIVPLPFNGKQESIAQINASNSVIGAPYALALSPDRRTAFVVETLGAMPVGATHRDQLPSGNRLVAIDLANPSRPVVQSQIAVAPKPEGGIEFWQVIQRPKLKLQRTGYIVDLDRGVHQVLVAR